MDAPSRGHDLKLTDCTDRNIGSTDAPSRGHDLKLYGALYKLRRYEDAPSRGHDLKPTTPAVMIAAVRCPLTGA